MPVSTTVVGDGDCQLRQTLPAVALLSWAGVPHLLQHLVRLKRSPPIKKRLRQRHRSSRFPGKWLRKWRHPGGTVGEGSTQRVSRSGLFWSTAAVAVSLGSHSQRGFSIG